MAALGSARLRRPSAGVRGQIYLGGPGLARGYLNRPGLSADAFVPHPFSQEPGARLYKTGDLAYYLSDGRVVCLGRIDGQVKVRGYRIELGEIEAALRNHPQVREAAVLVREDSPGDPRLVAYVVPEQGPCPTASMLRDSLEKKLPGYMVPSAYVSLDALPLAPNRKLDRRRLPPPDGAGRLKDGNLAAPRDEMELELTRIWTDVLGVQ